MINLCISLLRRKQIRKIAPMKYPFKDIMFQRVVIVNAICNACAFPTATGQNVCSGKHLLS